MANPWRGNCYESAVEYVREQPERARSNFTIVHGSPTMQKGGPHPGRKFGHAWVEVGDMVLDRTASPRGEVWMLPREVYYALGRIDPAECHRYTYREAVRAIARLKHWGPWHKEAVDIL